MVASGGGSPQLATSLAVRLLQTPPGYREMREQPRTIRTLHLGKLGGRVGIRDEVPGRRGAHANILLPANNT